MFENRIQNLQNLLRKQSIDALLVTSSYNISYLSGIFAFSIEEREARILITKQNIYLFTDARYTEMVKTKAPFVALLEISSKKSFLKLLKQTLDKEKINSLHFEEENITYKEIADIEEEIQNIQLIPDSDIVESLREIKDDDEIEKIKKACSLSDLAFEFILKYLKPEVSELEIKSKLENFIRQNGGELSFESIVAFGKNSAIPHHLSDYTKLKANDIILLDFGAKVEKYTSDMTRTIHLGKPNTKFTKIYKDTLNSQKMALDYLKNHSDKTFKTNLTQRKASNFLKSQNLPEIPHAIGHGVGLAVHENPVISPFSEEKLKPGMVVTIEPGVYIPNFGGVRIEDTVLITTDGIEILTNSPKTLMII